MTTALNAKQIVHCGMDAGSIPNGSFPWVGSNTPEKDSNDLAALARRIWTWFASRRSDGRRPWDGQRFKPSPEAWKGTETNWSGTWNDSINTTRKIGLSWC